MSSHLYLLGARAMLSYFMPAHARCHDIAPPLPTGSIACCQHYVMLLLSANEERAFEFTRLYMSKHTSMFTIEPRCSGRCKCKPWCGNVRQCVWCNWLENAKHHVFSVDGLLSTLSQSYGNVPNWPVWRSIRLCGAQINVV